MFPQQKSDVLRNNFIIIKYKKPPSNLSFLTLKATFLNILAVSDFVSQSQISWTRFLFMCHSCALQRDNVPFTPPQHTLKLSSDFNIPFPYTYYQRLYS